ncbi:MAG TPA: serine/threonine protein kinase [Verrucomicrobiae bacterium]|nr:serine/threonine protein kinase [Verrucomicrobiae bacterium]
MTGRFKLPIWVLPLAIAGLVAVLGWWGEGKLRDTIQDQLKAQLTATLNANVTALGIWTTNQTRLATSLAEDPTVRTLANKILQAAPPSRREFRMSPPPDLEQFVTDFRPRLAHLGYEVAQLVNTNFMVVANSSRAQPFGNIELSDSHTNKFSELFASGQPVIITPFKPELLVQRRFGRPPQGTLRTNDFRRFNRPPQNTGRPRRGDVTLMQVAAPVRDDAKTVVGALALIINPDKEFSRILSVARSGDSGETYAFDQTGLLISHSRFDAQLKQLGLLEATNTSSALNLRLHDPGGDLTKGYQLVTNTDGIARSLTRLVASAVDGEDTVDVTPARDYRGVPVVGASCWLPEFGFGVATQIDAGEAYRPLHVLQMVFVVLILFLLLCATGMFVVSNITWSRRLSEAELKLKQLGQYTLEEKIGAGGMGVVYRARHALMRRDTAVKLLLPDRADSAAIARFEREVCLTCQLTHPNTIQVYDYGHTPDGIFYYAMEYLRGLNLHDLVQRYGPQAEGRVIHILSQVCDSLAEAHGVGLIHRDIKPGNIFLCHRGGVADCVKVLDFGLVREYRGNEAEGGSPQSDGIIEGTPWFMPPEAIQGTVKIDQRSDLYSMGALGYFLLTGYYIFDAETVAEIHEKQLNAAPIPPSQRTAQPISAELEQLLLCCLAKDPADRPQSADDLRARLLACSASANWPTPARAAWWEVYERQPIAGPGQNAADTSTPMATVRVDLANRVE